MMAATKPRKCPRNSRVHVDDATHAAAKAFCRTHGKDMSRWLSRLVRDAAARGDLANTNGGLGKR